MRHEQRRPEFIEVDVAADTSILSRRPRSNSVMTDRRSAVDAPLISSERLRAEQIKALFDSVTIAVIGAAISAAVLAGEIVKLGHLDVARGVAWTSFITACAFAHIILRVAFGRMTPTDFHLTPWCVGFTLIALGEGLGWGWASVFLLEGQNFDVNLLVMVVVYGIASGSLPAFSCYLPAFYAFFLPTTMPFMVESLAATDPLPRAGALLSILFVVVMGGLGWRANRTFSELVRLRLATQSLANDLGRQKNIAEEANLAKSSFLAAASHDLRQPVHALGLFVSALRGTELPPDARRLTDQIEASIDGLDILFTSLLDISKLDAGVVEVHRQAFVIGPLLDRVCRDYANEAEVKGIRLTHYASSAVVWTDAVLLERLLRNLVSNAIRYTDRGRVVVGCRRRAALLSIEVWDTGRGIPIAMQQKVFQEYVQLGNPERDRSKGLGLGLAIVRRMSDLLGCELIMRSRPDHGSCFGIRVPRADSARIVAREVATDDAVSVQGKLIVVVDDESAIRDAMTSLLGSWGYAVIVAGDGDEVVRLLASCPRKPDLLISDYRLRGEENGIALIERLQGEYNEQIPAMLITGDTAPDRLVQAATSGLLLLHKPVSRSKLRASIAALIARAEVENAVEDTSSAAETVE